MKTAGNEIILSNGKAFRYNPHIFNKDSVLSWSIRKDEWLVTEEVILTLISLFNITEINFAGKRKVTYGDDDFSATGVTPFTTLDKTIDFTKFNTVKELKELLDTLPEDSALPKLSYKYNRY